ncbi:MAG: hypothetical protein AB7L41_05115 [Flavobacteriaceae bacterium]
MPDKENDTVPERRESLELRYHNVGISAVAAAAKYCPPLKSKPAEYRLNPQMAAAIDGSD